jgi:hypothetical protein
MATTLEREEVKTAKKYTLTGTLLEACNCGVLCPCWIGEDPDNGYCNAIVAYHIDKGEIQGIDVSGMNIMAVVHIPGNVLTPASWKVIQLIDERATPEQLQALGDAFGGKLGGPLADLAGLVGEVLGVYQVPIDHQLQGGAGTVTVGNKVKAVMVPYKSAYGTTTTLHDTVFSTIPGAPAWVSKASELTINFPEHGFEWSFKNSNAVQGDFHMEF